MDLTSVDFAYGESVRNEKKIKELERRIEALETQVLLLNHVTFKLGQETNSNIV